jgi:hypothetical protein
MKGKIMISRKLIPGDTVLVVAGTHQRAVSSQAATEALTVVHAYPAGDRRVAGMAGTVIGFADGHEQVYRTNSEWIMV